MEIQSYLKLASITAIAAGALPICAAQVEGFEVVPQKITQLQARSILKKSTEELNDKEKTELAALINDINTHKHLLKQYNRFK